MIYRSPTVAPPAPPVWVAMAQLPQEQLPPGLNPLERKRRGIWLNDERNAVIMSLANALRTGKLKRLAKYGFPPAVIRRWTAVLKTIQGQSLMPRALIQLAVVVESLEHAQQLRALLHPEAALAGAAREKDEGLWMELLDVPIVILTAAEARRAGLPPVVLRSDGAGTSWCEMVGRWGDEWMKGPLLLVDVLDSFDERAIRDSWRRRSDYLDRGFSLEPAERQGKRRTTHPQ
jgi:hypothetical protein